MVALLVESTVNCELEELAPVNSNVNFVRKSIRGQSVDRAGLSSKHIQLMKQLSDPVGLNLLAQRLGWTEAGNAQSIGGIRVGGFGRAGIEF